MDAAAIWARLVRNYESKLARDVLAERREWHLAQARRLRIVLGEFVARHEAEAKRYTRDEAEHQTTGEDG